MRISGHNTNGEVVENLLKIMLAKQQGQEEQPKTAAKPVTGMDIFSSHTEDELRQVQIDQLKEVAAELDFQAKQAGVRYTQDDFVKFAQENRKLRGKALERAARRFCSTLYRDNAPPQGTTRRTAEYLENLGSHNIIPAGYKPSDDPNAGPNNSATGRPLGCERNPNTMWEPDAIVRTAQIPSNDERTAAEKRHNAEQRQERTQKAAMDRLAEAAQWAMSKGLRKTESAPSNEANFNPKVGNNHMSMFSPDRDFEGVGEDDSGKQIREAADERAHKKEAARAEWNQAKPAENTRSAIDKLFEGWLNK